ncbi:hypothetical protein GKE82_10985 [Conexibacter sp. W3-3-2]|uniref:Uncharacterized protein n=1 Tax=Paraconexibacter algicola TaxID=2133960 RepID=A0A2T4UH29_9ACTN|nr:MULTISPECIES: hypothetical protein [Solirubrobacterales]MTD44800.1 hypothetical protein [Conexibacter sp. W3-3-2]PTL58540.1 hypothetical protein C7Y72_02145 [Paraconexibacter algicola]
MASPNFRFVAPPAALDGITPGWAIEMLRDGEIALVVDDGGLAAIDATAHALDLVTVQVVRTEADQGAQERTVIAYATRLPTIWCAPSFTDGTKEWARKRGPMTLLVEIDGPLPEEERRRIERFVAILGRQSE